MDLEFLLSPQPWETIADHLSQRITEQLAALRKARGLTVQKMSRQSGMSQARIANVEFGDSILTMVPFQNYLKFTTYMGVSFQEIFSRALLQTRESEAVRVNECSLMGGEDAMIERVRQAVQYLAAHGEPVTERALRRMARLAHMRLVKYPRVKAFLKEAVCMAQCERERREEQQNEEIFEIIQGAAQRLEALGQRVTLKALSEVAGLPLYRLKTVPQVIALMNQLYEREKRQKQLDEREFTNVRRAAQQLEASGQRVTLKMLSEVTGLPSRRLRNDLQAPALLNQHRLEYSHLIESQAQKLEDRLLVEVEEAVRQLECSGETVSHGAITKITGRKRRELRTHSRVWALVQSSVEASRQKRRKKQEDEFVTRVAEAFDELEASGEPVTKFDVYQKAGIPYTHLYKYPGVVSYMQRRAAEAKHRKQFVRSQLHV